MLNLHILIQEFINHFCKLFFFVFFSLYSKTSSVSIAYRVQVPDSKTASVKGTGK